MMPILQGACMLRIRLDQIDTPGDNFNCDEIDIGAGNSTFGVIKSARMRGLEVRRVCIHMWGQRSVQVGDELQGGGRREKLRSSNTIPHKTHLKRTENTTSILFPPIPPKPLSI